MNTLKLYIRSMGILLKCQLEYPLSFFLQTLAQLVMEGGELLAVILLVDRFDHLKGWSAGDLYFFFGLMSVTFYITECFGRGITGNFPYLVRTGQLDTLLEKTTEEQKDVTVTIHDTRVRGNDVSLPINDLLYVEAQKNNVVVGYVKDGKLAKEELQTTLAAVLNDLGEYGNVFQCHRSFIVNLNNISSAKGNSNGYVLELGGGLATVPVSRSFVPKLKSFIA